jgi:cysteine synthase B
MGVGRFLKERDPNIQVWAIEPPAGEMVDGLRSLDDGYIPPIFLDNDGYELLDRKIVIGPRESIEWTRQLLDQGLFVGISSGCAMAGAVRCASQIDKGVIVLVSADGGWKYLSSGVWTDSLDVVTERARSTIYF